MVKVALEALFELEKPCAIFGGVRHIGKDTHKVVAIDFTFVLPDAADGLRLERSGTEMLANRNQYLADDASV